MNQIFPIDLYPHVLKVVRADGTAPFGYGGELYRTPYRRSALEATRTIFDGVITNACAWKTAPIAKPFELPLRRTISREGFPEVLGEPCNRHLLHMLVQRVYAHADLEAIADADGTVDFGDLVERAQTEFEGKLPFRMSENDLLYVMEDDLARHIFTFVMSLRSFIDNLKHAINAYYGLAPHRSSPLFESPEYSRAQPGNADTMQMLAELWEAMFRRDENARWLRVTRNALTHDLPNYTLHFQLPRERDDAMHTWSARWELAGEEVREEPVFDRLEAVYRHHILWSAGAMQIMLGLRLE